MSFESQSQIQPSSDRAEFISNKKQDKNDDGSLDDLSISNDHKAKYRFCSYITKTAKKKVEAFDLTHDSDEDKKKPSGVKVKTEKRFVLDPVEQDPDSVIFSYESPKKKKGDNNRACMHCGSIKCHDDQFSDFAFANVQRLFASNKALTTPHHAYHVFVEAYNAAVDYAKFNRFKTLAEMPNPVVPPSCIEYGGLEAALKWFGIEKAKYVKFVSSTRESERIREKRYLFDHEAEWKEYKEKLCKRKYGDI